MHLKYVNIALVTLVPKTLEVTSVVVYNVSVLFVEYVTAS